jgi:hypothetical protein
MIPSILFTFFHSFMSVLFSYVNIKDWLCISLLSYVFRTI